MGDATAPTPGRDVDTLLADLLGSSSEDEGGAAPAPQFDASALESASGLVAASTATPSPPRAGTPPRTAKGVLKSMPAPADLISPAPDERGAADPPTTQTGGAQHQPPAASPSPSAWATPAAALAGGLSEPVQAEWASSSLIGDLFFTPSGAGGGMEEEEAGGRGRPGSSSTPPPPPAHAGDEEGADADADDEDLTSAPALDAAEEAERVRAAGAGPPPSPGEEEEGGESVGQEPGTTTATSLLLSGDAFVDAPPAPRGSTPPPLLGTTGLLCAHAADPYLAGAPLLAAGVSPPSSSTSTPPPSITALASFHAVTALGTSTGSILVIMPRLGLPNPDGSERSAGGHVGPLVHRLGDGGSSSSVPPGGGATGATPHPPPPPSSSSSASRAVTALAFSPTGTLLAAGHADGDVSFWELRGRAGWECVRAVRDAHVSPVSALAWVEVPGAAAGVGAGGVVAGVVPGAAMAGAAAAAAAAVAAGAASAVAAASGSGGGAPPLPTTAPALSALSADARGRVAFHPVPAYQSPLGAAAGSLAGKLVGLAGAVGRAAGVGGGGGGGGSRPGLLLDGTAHGPVSLMAGLPGGPTGMLLLVTDSSALVARVAWAGGVGGVGGAARLSLLHSIPRPGGLSVSALLPAAPAAAWRLAAPNLAALALSWGAKGVEVYDVELPTAAPAAAVPRSPGRSSPAKAGETALPALPPPAPTAAWAEPTPVAALAWMDGPALAVLTGGGGGAAPAALRLYGGTSTSTEKDALDLGAPLLSSAPLPRGGPGPPLPRPPPWSASPDRFVVCLARGGGGSANALPPPSVALLLGWGDRLSALGAAGRWRAALGAALAGVSALRATAPLPLWRGEGRGLTLAAATQAAADLVCVYARAGLTLPPTPPTTSTAHADLPARVAAVSVSALIAADPATAGEVAWRTLGPLFEGVPGGADALVGALADAVLGGQVVALPPDAVQMLAARAASVAGGGQGDGAAHPPTSLSDLERVVLRLDIGSLDFHSVARLLAGNGGTAGLASLFLRGPGDPAPPGACLLLAAADPGLGPPARKAAATLRFLTFLRCCVRGEVFPPGSGPPLADPAARDRARAAALGLLLHSTAASVASGVGELGVTMPPGWGEGCLPGPHAALRLAAGVDPAAAWAVAAEALDGWDALEEELCGAARVPQPAAAVASEEGASIRTAAQSTVDAATALLAARALPPEGAARALALVARLVADGRAGAGAAALHAALEHAALGRWPGGGSGGGGEPAAASSDAPSLARREALFIRLLRAGVATGDGGPASGLDLPAARALARSAGFVRAEAEAHAAAGDVGAALDCLLRAGAADPSAAFAYAERVLSGGGGGAGPGDPARAALRDALLARAAALAGADGGAAAALILRHFPDDAHAVCSALAGTPDLQFAYLRGAVNAAEVLGVVGAVGADADAADADATTAAAATHPSTLLADPAVGDLYIRLLARYDPAGLPRFLSSPVAAYRAEEALRVVQAAAPPGSVPPSAEAFLRERLGDVVGAAAIVSACLSEAVRGVLGAQTGAEVEALAASAAQPALAAAVGLATRARDDLPRAAASALWLQVLDAVADPLVTKPPPGASILPSARAAVAGLVDSVAAAAAGPGGGLARRSVGEHLLARHGRAPAADVGGALAGLLGALAREASLLEAAASLATADAQRAFRAVVAARGRALRPVTVDEDDAAAFWRPTPARPPPACLALAPAGEAALQAAARRRGSMHEDGVGPGSPLHRGGVDVTFLRENDVRL